jgi:hypothetical protein
MTFGSGVGGSGADRRRDERASQELSSYFCGAGGLSRISRWFDRAGLTYANSGVASGCQRTGSIEMKIPRFQKIALLILAALQTTPLNAQVLLNPSEIITSSDYPSDAVNDEGVTFYELFIGSNGRAERCFITVSSGHKSLDDKVCERMLAKAKFDVSSSNAGSPVMKYAGRVTWSALMTVPRALYGGVTANEFPSKVDPQKKKCVYSDGKIRFINAEISCDRSEYRKQVIQKNVVYNFGIIDTYIDEFKRRKDPEAAFNAAIILLENEYEYGFSLMEQSSALGNSIASSTLCSLYANEYTQAFNRFNPNQALEYCILSYKQQYSYHIYYLTQQILEKFGSRLDEATRDRALATIKLRNHSRAVSLITPGNEVIRPKDYPNRENVRQVGGKTYAMMLISAAGTVDSCLVIQSTYSHALDQKVCKRMREAAVFSPAVIDGVNSPQWYYQSVNWKPWEGSREPNRSILMNIILGILGAAL